MNALDRLNRALSVTLCAALLSAALPREALARVVTRVPVQSSPAGVAAAGAVFDVVRGPALSLAAPSLGLAPSLTPVHAPALVPGAPGDAPALERDRPLLRPGQGPVPLAAADAEFKAAAGPVERDSEFKAEAGVSAVADAPAIARGFAALKRLFATRSAGDIAAPNDSVRAEAARAPERDRPLLRPGQGPVPLAAADDGKGGPPAPPAAPTPSAPDDEPVKGWFGMGKAAVAFIGALLVAQVGVEALGNAMPVVAQRVFGDFTVVAQLAVFSSIAGIIGRQFGPLVVQRFGLRNTYLSTEILRMASISTLLGLLLTGHMTIPLMMAFYSLNGFLGGIAVTAESSIPPALVGQDQAKLEKFWTWEQTLLEIVGSLGPIAAGFAIDHYGAGPTLAAFPISFAAAFAVLFFTLRIPQRIEQLRQIDLQRKKESGTPSGNVLAAFFKKVAHGAKVVWAAPLLRYSFLAYTAYMLLNPFLYSMIAPAFGRMIAGPEGMGGVSGIVTGLYSAGGLIGGLLMMREQKAIKKAKDSGAMSDEQESEALRRSMRKWMLWTIPTLAAFGTMAFALPTLGSLAALPVWLSWAAPLTLPALALIPFGVAQVISMVKLRSYFQSKVPNAQDMADAMGFLGSASLAASTLGILGLKFLFQHTAGTTSFVIIAATMVPLGVYYFYITRKLNSAAAPRG